MEVNANGILELGARVRTLEETVELVRFQAELNKQKLLRCSLCIVGVPRTSDECLKSIAAVIFRHVGYGVAFENIDACYRINNRIDCDTFIVKLKDVHAKRLILRAKFGKRLSLITSDTGYPCTLNRPIYINNHVTPFFGRLIAAGRKAIKEKRIHSCWMSAQGPVMKLEVNDKQQHVYYSVEHLTSTIENRRSKTVVSTATTINRPNRMGANVECGDGHHII